MPTPTIRPYTPEDELACMMLFAANTPEFFDPNDDDEYLRFLRADDRGEYLILEHAGEVLACGGWYLTPTGVGGLTWGMVHPDHRRRGHGSRLLRHRLALLRAVPGAWAVVLHTTPAVEAFFGRFGFRTYRRVPDGFGRGLDKCSMRLLWTDG